MGSSHNISYFLILTSTDRHSNNENCYTFTIEEAIKLVTYYLLLNSDEDQMQKQIGFLVPKCQTQVIRKRLVLNPRTNI